MYMCSLGACTCTCTCMYTVPVLKDVLYMFIEHAEEGGGAGETVRGS